MEQFARRSDIIVILSRLEKSANMVCKFKNSPHIWNLKIEFLPLLHIYIHIVSKLLDGEEQQRPGSPADSWEESYDSAKKSNTE